MPIRAQLYWQLNGDILTHFMPLISFYTPLKTSETLCISEKDQWHEMG